MARGSIQNNPISHCFKGQGGRTFSSMKPGGKKSGSESRKMRQKTAPQPSGRQRFPFGKWYDWIVDPDKLTARRIKDVDRLWRLRNT